MIRSLTLNLPLKILSLMVALVLWFFVMGEQRVEKGYAIPLELKNIPEGMIVVNEIPSLVDVRISGPRTLLSNLRPTDINISVDLKDLQPGLTSFKRLDERLNIPSALKVTRLSPSFVDVKLERIKQKEVPVRSQVVGTPAAGFRVGTVVLDPDKVLIEGAEGEIKDVNEVVTEKVDVEGVQESFSLIVALNYRGKFTALKDHKTTEVRVSIEPDEKPDRKTEKAGKEKAKQ